MSCFSCHLSLKVCFHLSAKPRFFPSFRCKGFASSEPMSLLCASCSSLQLLLEARPWLALPFGPMQLLCIKQWGSCNLNLKTKSKQCFHPQLLMPRSSLRMPLWPLAVLSWCWCSPTEGRRRRPGIAGSGSLCPHILLAPPEWMSEARPECPSVSQLCTALLAGFKSG